MKISFGLVTEGRTDQAVIRAILAGYFGDDNIRVTSLNPGDKNKLVVQGVSLGAIKFKQPKPSPDTSIERASP